MLRRVLCLSVALAAVIGSVSVPVDTARADTAQSIAHYIMGLSYEFQEESEAALLEYQKAVLLDPACFAAQMRLGVTSSERGKPLVAIKAFSAAISLDPSDMQAHYLLAIVYSSVKDFDRAAQQYEIILKNFTTIEPQNIEFYAYLGELYFSQGKIEEGVTQFEKILSIQPNHVQALLQVGVFYLDNKRRPEGVELLKRCVDTDPAAGDCLNALGYAYAEDGVHLSEARDMVTRALAIEPDNAAFLDSLGWVSCKQGRLGDALELLQKAAAKEEDPAIYDHMGDVYEKLGKMDQALQMWQKAFSLDAEMAGLKVKISRAQAALKKK